MTKTLLILSIFIIFLLSFSGLYASDVDYLNSADLQSPVDYGIIVPDNSSHSDAINTVDDNYQKHNKIQNLGNLNAEDKSINIPHENGKKSVDINIQPTVKIYPRNYDSYVCNPLYGETFTESYSCDEEVISLDLNYEGMALRSYIVDQDFEPISLDYQIVTSEDLILSNQNSCSVGLTNFKDDISYTIIRVEFDNLNSNPINYDSKDSKQIPINNLYADTNTIGNIYLGNKNYIKGNAKELIIFEPKNIFIESNDLILKYGCDDYFEAVLTDDEDNFIQNQTVLFSIGQKTYAAKTDKYGIARIQINLKPGKYIIYTYFKGSDNYNKANSVNTIIIRENNESKTESGLVHSISENTVQNNTISQTLDSYDTISDSNLKTFSLNQIIKTSKSLKKYYQICGNLPETVKLASIEVNLHEFLYYQSRAILNIENKNEFGIKRINSINNGFLMDATSINNVLYKIRYLDAAEEVSNYILNNNCYVESIITSIGQISNTQLIDTFAGILDYYSYNNHLPEFVIVNGNNPSNLPSLKEDPLTLDDNLKEDILISACNVKMDLEEDKYFQLKLKDGFNNPLKNEQIFLTIKRYKLEYDIKKQYFNYKYANTTRYTVKTNNKGVALLKLNLKTGYYKVNAIFNKDGIFKSCSNEINVNTGDSNNYDGDSTQKLFNV